MKERLGINTCEHEIDFAIFVFLALSSAGKILYVSRLFGNDNTTCGTPLLPCRTISYAIHQASEASYIYLDGTGTSKDPYSCQPLKPGYSVGIYLTKSISFVGFKSRAYVSCHHGNVWLVDGRVKHNHGLQVSFKGLAFHNTSFRFFDVMVNVSDCWFANSEHVSMNFMVSNLPMLDLNLNAVAFNKNRVCISVTSNNRKNIRIRITNSTFIQNGLQGFPLSNLSSVLWLKSQKSTIIIHLRNCTFKNNKLGIDGMIFVENSEGSTHLNFAHFKMEKNGRISAISGIPNDLFYIHSAQVIMILEFGFVYKTYGTFIFVEGRSSNIIVSNTEVDNFYSPDFTMPTAGGVIHLNETLSAFLSIKDSSFRNGKDVWHGGAVCIVAPTLKLIIQDTAFHNVSSTKYGGAVFMLSTPEVSKTSNSAKDFVVHLNIVNSSFTENVSLRGGAVVMSAKNVTANVVNSMFKQNNAKISGAALYLEAYETAAMCLRNVHLIENTAGSGGIVYARVKPSSKNSTFKFTTNNVWFVKNKVNGQQYPSGILYLWIERYISNLNFKNTHFTGNTGKRSNTLFLFLLNNSKPFHFVTLNTCIFKKNNANLGAMYVVGQAILIFKNSTFDSNIHSRCRGPALAISLNDSKITISNSKFINNYCGAVSIKISESSYFKTENSIFVGNRRMNASIGAMAIVTTKANLDKTHIRFRTSKYNVFIKNASFQGNIAASGSVLTVVNGKVKLQNCTFLNNFARFNGGQITSFGSTDIKISNSVFKETVEKAFFSNGKLYTASGFLRIHSTGKFLFRNTSATANTRSYEPLILVSKAMWVNIDNSSVTTCPLGSNIKRFWYYYEDINNRTVVVLNLSCKQCGYNFYSLQRGHAKAIYANKSFMCMPCPRGADCFPAIKSKTNFWGYPISVNPLKLAFAICPFGYCKSPQPNGSEYNACEGQRTGVMCGECSLGYTEALWSTHCTSVDNCNDDWFWIAFLALVVSLAILLVFKPPFIAYSLKQIIWLRNKLKFRTSINSQTLENYNVTCSFSSYEESTQENRPLLSTAGQLNRQKRQFSRFLEIIFYFYQIAQLLLSSYSLSEFFDTKFLPPILSFFNFEPSFTRRGFLCPFPGLTPKTKLLSKTVPVFGTMIAIFVIYIASLLVRKLRGITTCSHLSSYLEASIKTIFLGYVSLAVVSISLIRCVSVAGETRWFYNGNIICYQWWQYASFAFIGFFAFPFIFVVAWASFKIQHDAITMRQFILAIIFPLPCLLLWLFQSIWSRDRTDFEENRDSNTYVLKELLLGPYRKPKENGSKYSGAFYWQSVLIARRFVLVLLYCVLTEPSIKLFCMTIFCVVVLCCHLIVKPFRNSLANNIESLSLFLLVILGLINLFKSVFVGVEGNIKGSLVTVFQVFQWMEIVILGLFPIVLSLLMGLATLCLLIRTLFTSCKCLFQCVLRCYMLRWGSVRQNLLHTVCEERND